MWLSVKRVMLSGCIYQLHTNHMNMIRRLLIICWTFFLAQIWIIPLSNGRELYSNNITGKIPEELGNLTNLVSLDLYLNHLSGNIPNTLGKLQKLRFLYGTLSLFSYLWSAKFMYVGFDFRYLTFFNIKYFLLPYAKSRTWPFHFQKAAIYIDTCL